MSLVPLAFLMGFFGSLHCAVMCGPIVLALPVSKDANWQNLIQLLLYQLGRILVYALLGFLVGAVGNVLAVFIKQETLSLTVGVLLVVFTVMQLSGRRWRNFQHLQGKVVAPISKAMTKLFTLPFWGFFVGMLNGLIPCGMVYLALATALHSANYQSGAIFMLWFGLGTLPLMLFVSIGKLYLKRYLRFNSQKLIPWFALFMGTLFILRSANLGIPFISPSTHSSYGATEKCG
jgi:sulfite exporter TauE/SafE